MTIPPWKFSKGFTPKPIQQLIQLIAAVSVTSVLIDSIFTINTQQFFALSPEGYLWQLFTSLFFIPGPFFSFSYMLDVAFCLLILWLIGSLLYERIGKKKFFIAYALSGLVGGITALCMMQQTHSFFYASECLYAILGIATLWTMSDPYQQLIIFFVLPIKAKWLLVFALAGTILSNLVDHNFAQAAAYFATFIFSWLFGLVVLRLEAPLTGWSLLIGCAKKSTTGWTPFSMGDTYKLRTRDEHFLDKTLDKISKAGQESLSLYEKLRLKWISFKKKK